MAWLPAECTVALLRRFGPPIVVGVEHRENTLNTSDAEVDHIDWRDNFADARNQLASFIDAVWLLWTGADEELAGFDTTETAGLRALVTAVWLHDRRGYTARSALRLQRLGMDARWKRVRIVRWCRAQLSAAKHRRECARARQSEPGRAQ